MATGEQRWPSRRSDPAPLTDEIVEKPARRRPGAHHRHHLRGRDAAHKRLVDAAGQGRARCPSTCKGQIIYYVGPIAGQAGTGHRLGRTHHQRPHGRLRARADGRRASRA